MAAEIPLATFVDPAQVEAALKARFHNVKRDGLLWTAACPNVHENPYGETITFRPNGAFISCSGGCLFDQVMAAVEGERLGDGDRQPETPAHARRDVPPPENATKPSKLPAVKKFAELVFPLTPELIRRDPPRREYLLTVPSTGAGILARGKVGLFAGRGGSGKTWALAQLAVAVATGTTWLGEGRGWKAARGRVLWLPAEEDAEEVQRRIHYAAQAVGLLTNVQDLELLAKNIVAIPLCGHNVTLSASDESRTAQLPETVRAIEIRELLRDAARDEEQFALVILDPLSRFAGADVEKDNAQATRFVQVVESFTSPDCGGPNVLMGHHRSKQKKDENTDSADPIRGTSALVDAVRWAALLEPERRAKNAPKDGPQILKLKVVKTNYAQPSDPLSLIRPDGWHGAMHVAHPDECAAIEANTKKENGPTEAVLRMVFDSISQAPASGSELARRLRTGKEDALSAVEQLRMAGKIHRIGNTWRICAPMLPLKTATAGETGKTVPEPIGTDPQIAPEPVGPDPEVLNATR